MAGWPRLGSRSWDHRRERTADRNPFDSRRGVEAVPEDRGAPNAAAGNEGLRWFLPGREPSDAQQASAVVIHTTQARDLFPTPPDDAA